MPCQVTFGLPLEFDNQSSDTSPAYVTAISICDGTKCCPIDAVDTHQLPLSLYHYAVVCPKPIYSSAKGVARVAICLGMYTGRTYRGQPDTGIADGGQVDLFVFLCLFSIIQNIPNPCHTCRDSSVRRQANTGFSGSRRSQVLSPTRCYLSMEGQSA